MEIFSYDEQDIRTVMKDGEPWFVAADVCAVLGLGNTSMATSKLAGQDKGVSSIDTPGGSQNMTTVNESGLYDLILDSRKPEAKKFRRWVTSEVLPAIRRDGGYLAPEVDFSDPDVMAKLLANWSEDRRKRLEAEAEVIELKPRAKLIDDLFKPGPVNVRNAARWLGEVEGIDLHERELTGLLRDWGWIEKGSTAATVKSRGPGWMQNRMFEVNGRFRTQGRLTQKGFGRLLTKLYQEEVS